MMSYFTHLDLLPCDIANELDKFVYPEKIEVNKDYILIYIDEYKNYGLKINLDVSKVNIAGLSYLLSVVKGHCPSKHSIATYIGLFMIGYKDRYFVIVDEHGEIIKKLHSSFNIIIISWLEKTLEIAKNTKFYGPKGHPGPIMPGIYSI